MASRTLGSSVFSASSKSCSVAAIPEAVTGAFSNSRAKRAKRLVAFQPHRLDDRPDFLHERGEIRFGALLKLRPLGGREVGEFVEVDPRGHETSCSE